MNDEFNRPDFIEQPKPSEETNVFSVDETVTQTGSPEGPVEEAAVEPSEPKSQAVTDQPEMDQPETDRYGEPPGHTGRIRYSEPDDYRYTAGEPSRSRRGLFGTLSMVLIGAILGSALTMASGWYLINEKGLLRTVAGNTVPGSTVTGQTTGKIITAPPAETGETSENQVAAVVTPSVVGITTRTQVSSLPFFGQDGSNYVEGVGSGVILSSDGYIVTNSHVVDNGDAGDIRIIFADETSAPGEVIWSDAALDLAIVKTDRNDLEPVVIGSSEAVKVGDKAIAIGNPLGLDLQSTLTSGYISGLDRSITVEGGATMSGLIQTDAAINEGNSGGALLNTAGQLIGINTAKAGGTASGIGFAIPIDTVKPIIEKVISDGDFKSVYLGVTGMNVGTIRAQGQPLDFEGDSGVFIMEVMRGTAAAEAGLKSEDVITRIEDHEIDGMTDLKKALLNYKVGDKVKVTYYRGKSEKTTDLTFAQDSSTIEDFFNQEDTQP